MSHEQSPTHLSSLPSALPRPNDVSDNERYFTKHPAANYLLPSDEAERARLQFQHDLLKRETGLALIPSDCKLQPGDKILDSGTGAGVWAVDAATNVPPGVSITGCDIEPRLFPLDPPINTSFCTQSVLSLPSDWSSMFTLVHQRLLVCALGLSDWQTALSELYRVTSVGGMLLVEEVGSMKHIREPTPTRDYASELPYTFRYRCVMEELFRRRNLLLDCGARLPKLIADAGFVKVEQKTTMLRLGPGEATKDARANFMAVYRSLKTPVMKLDGLGLIQSEADWDQLMDNMETEWEANNFGYEFLHFTARKE